MTSYCIDFLFFRSNWIFVCFHLLKLKKKSDILFHQGNKLEITLLIKHQTLEVGINLENF